MIDIQVALYFFQEGSGLRNLAQRACQAERGGSFVENAQGFHARVIFRQAAFSEQAGGAVVSGAVVDGGHAEIITRLAGKESLLAYNI